MNATSEASSGNHRLVHGMERALVVADWLALTDDEVRAVLARVDDAEWPGTSDGVSGDVHVTWSSPRPMSAAALVGCAHGEFFLKRHHVSVRSPERLRVEHARRSGARRPRWRHGGARR